MTRIKINELTKVFDDGAQDIVAVDDVSIEVDDGEFVVLVGPSGCGKTTMLRMIGGLETPTEGTIEFDGTVVNDINTRNRDVAMVFQDFALYPHLSVRENLGFGLRREGNDHSDAEIEQRIVNVAEMLEIGDLLEKRPSELSGGQKQRVALGRAIAREPRLFLFDEPLANLDANLRKTMRTEIDALQSEVGITSLYVTHNQEEAMTMGDKIAILNDGQLQQLGAPEDVFNRPANTFVAQFIGSPNINFVQGELEREGDIYNVTHDTATVEIRREDLVDPDTNAQSVTIGFRPQDLARPSQREESTLGFSGQVEIIEPLGTNAIVTLDSKYGEIRAMMSNYQSLVRGDVLRLVVDAEALYLFDGRSRLLKGREITESETAEITR